MAVSLGKRKRRRDADESGSGAEDEGELRALFQKAFEAKFKPLEQAPIAAITETVEVEGLDEELDSDWSGLSEDDDDEVIELHQLDSSHQDVHDSSHERKAFMSSKPPNSASEPTFISKKGVQKPDDDPKEATNLKHDLALQRLLKESHLLDPGSFTKAGPALNGKGRLDALNLRLKDLGAKGSPTDQKMPLSHRRGITAKAAYREERRRKDALENGVILEKAKHATKTDKRRVRSVGGPTVGKFQGGTLKLRTKDVKSIQGPPKSKRSRR